MRFRPTLLALALAAAFAPVHAQDKPAQDKSIEASVEAGAVFISGSDHDRGLFGQYSNWPNGSSVGALLGFDYSLRRPQSNAWVDAWGVNLGGHQRELGLEWKQPGEWKLGASYSELMRRDPETVVSAASSEFDLKTKRTALGINLSKVLAHDLVLDIDLKHEKKEGSRLFGRGFTCPSPVAPGCSFTTGIAVGWGVLLVPEPIDATHSQVEARLNYATGALRVSLGYYGSFYDNGPSQLGVTVPGALYNAVGDLLPLGAGLQAILSQPLALPPDNQSHQVDLMGTYDFGVANTRATFKVARAIATQNQGFAASGFTGPAGLTSLDGKVTTTLAKIGLTSRPMSRLSLQADLRYEDRDDDTPIGLYNIEGTTTYTNRQLPYRKVLGKVQGSWQITSDWRGTAGADYESIDRGVFTATSAISGVSALRQDTHETGVFAELRKRMGESVSGAVKVSTSRRNGSNWLRDNSGLGVTEVSDVSALPFGAILMPTLADRRRDKVKLFADWQANNALALQVSVEGGRDHYDVLSGYGFGSTSMGSVTVDASYAINDSWNATGYASYGRQALDQAKPFGYVMALRNTSVTAGLGVTGKVSGPLQVGGELSYSEDRSSYDQALDPLAGADSAILLAATGGLPDIVYTQAAIKLWGRYAIDKQSSVRADLIYRHYRWTDWAWGFGGVPFVYSDGAMVLRKPTQNVAFVGVVYRYQFR